MSTADGSPAYDAARMVIPPDASVKRPSLQRRRGRTEQIGGEVFGGAGLQLYRPEPDAQARIAVTDNDVRKESAAALSG